MHAHCYRLQMLPAVFFNGVLVSRCLATSVKYALRTERVQQWNSGVGTLGKRGWNSNFAYIASIVGRAEHNSEGQSSPFCKL